MIRMNRLKRPAFTAEAVNNETHSGVGVDGGYYKLRRRIHKPLDTGQESSRVIKMFDHLAGNDHVERFIQIHVLQILEVSLVKICYAIRRENIDPLLIEVETIKLASYSRDVAVQ